MQNRRGNSKTELARRTDIKKEKKLNKRRKDLQVRKYHAKQLRWNVVQGMSVFRF